MDWLVAIQEQMGKAPLLWLGLAMSLPGFVLIFRGVKNWLKNKRKKEAN